MVSHQAHEPAIVIDDRQVAEVLEAHHVLREGERLLREERHDGLRHDVPDVDRAHVRVFCNGRALPK